MYNNSLKCVCTFDFKPHLRALKKLEEELTHEAPRKRGLKRKTRPDKGKVDCLKKKKIPFRFHWKCISKM